VKKILFLSNGHGEDLIALEVVKVIESLTTDHSIAVLPLVGEGEQYHNHHRLTVLGPNKKLPSGGFLKSFKVFARDLYRGLLGLHMRQIFNARRFAPDLVVAVGDAFPLVLSRWFLKSAGVVFISTAKSDLFEPHYWVERLFMKPISRVYVRDEVTALSLMGRGVRAKYVGNIMMDAIGETQALRSSAQDVIRQQTLDLEKQERVLTLGILPGSRQEGVENLKRILEVVKHLPSSWEIIAAIPPSIEVSMPQLAVHCVEQVSFDDLLIGSDLVIGLAGTANEQCVGLGIPVFSFVGSGPQTTRKRFVDQQKLLGGGCTFIEEIEPAIIARTIIGNVKKSQFFEQVAQLGPKVMGPRGAATKIAKECVCILES
jgi:hypothetical protein